MNSHPYIPDFAHRNSYHRRKQRKVSVWGIYLLILILINVLLLSLDSFAQKGYMFGFQLSPNVSMGSMSYLSRPSTDFSVLPNAGIGGGFVFHYGFKYGFYKNISFRSGLLVSYKRFNIALKDDIVNFETQIFDLPVEIPFLLSIRIPLSEHSYLREYVGLSINYVRQISDKYAETGTVTRDDRLIDYSLSYQSKVLNGLTSGFIAGVAYEIEGYKGNLYDIGFSFHRGVRPEMVGSLNYSIENKEDNFTNSYSHELISNGSYIAFNLSIYLYEPKDCWMCWFW